MKKQAILAAICITVISSYAHAKPGMGRSIGMGKSYLMLTASEWDLGGGLVGNGFGLGFGSQINQAVGFTTEVSKLNLNDRGNYAGTAIDADGGGYAFSLGPEVYLSPNISIYGTAGVIRYSFDYDEVNGSNHGHYSDSAALLGGGVRLSFGRSLGLKVGYRHYTGAADANFDEQSGGLYSASLMFRF